MPGPRYCGECIAANGVPCADCPRPEVLEENDDAVALFHAVQTQVRRDRHGVFCGFDYAGVQAAMTLMPLSTPPPELFEKLRVMEQEILDIMKELAGRDDQD